MSDPAFRLPQGIVPALDVDSVDQLKRVVDQTSGVEGVVAYKLGATGALRLGLAGAVEVVRAHSDLPVIYDHQKAGPDIPDMAGKFAALCREADVGAVILFPLAGPDAVRQFAGEAQRRGIVPIVGGDLPVPEYHAGQGGFVVDDALDRILELSLEAGVEHFVVPATATEEIRTRAEWLRSRVRTPKLFMPGIGALGGSIETAFAAAPGCSRYAIVGRGIYGAPDPRDAASRLAEAALNVASAG